MVIQIDGWRLEHYRILCRFMNYINSVSRSYVLKGGTSLMLCYNLSRFSEDIDLDGFSSNIGGIVSNFCALNKFQCRVAKDTHTVKRFMINYGGTKPLKVEVSYRIKSINFIRDTGLVKNILVYNIQNILSMKLLAYSGRDKIRDLYDIVFISLQYWNVLGESLQFMVRDALAFKGVEQYDFVIKDQIDDLIDNEELASSFLLLWGNLGLN